MQTRDWCIITFRPDSKPVMPQKGRVANCSQAGIGYTSLIPKLREPCEATGEARPASWCSAQFRKGSLSGQSFCYLSIVAEGWPHPLGSPTSRADALRRGVVPTLQCTARVCNFWSGGVNMLARPPISDDAGMKNGYCLPVRARLTHSIWCSGVYLRV